MTDILAQKGKMSVQQTIVPGELKTKIVTSWKPTRKKCPFVYMNSDHFRVHLCFDLYIYLRLKLILVAMELELELKT